MSTSPPWFVIFKVQENDLIDACFRIMELYHRAKPDTEKLEAAVDELKKQYQDQRKKEHRNNASPAVTIVDRSNGSHNMWGGFIQRQVPSISSSNNADEKTDSKQKVDGKTVNSTNNNNESKGRSRSASRSRNSRSRSKSSDRQAKKKDRAKKRTHSRSSAESDYDKKSRKRDKKYKKSPKRDYREKSRERYSNGSRRRDYANDRDKERYSDKEYYGFSGYDKDKYSSKHSSRNGNRHHHKSRR